MRALVTGATGFLGSHLVELLVAEGVETDCLVLPGDELHWIGDLDVAVIEGDCTDRDSLRPALQRSPDLIFHLAGIANAPHDGLYHLVNARGTQNLIELCLEEDLPVRRFVFSSSASVMGPSNGGPPLKEADECRPVTEYGRSKVEAEGHVRALTGRIPWTIVRLGLIYGPRATHGFFPLFKMAAGGFLPLTGDLHGNLLHVTDAARSLLHVARHEAAVDRTYLAAGEETATLDELAEAIAGSLERRVHRLRVPFPLLYPAALTMQLAGRVRGRVPMFDLRRVEDMRHSDWRIDSSRIRMETGFETTIDLRPGIADTMSWYREQGWVKSPESPDR